MFNTMTGVKVVGGFGGALLVFLLLNMAGRALFGEGEGGKQAYVIDTGAATAPTKTAQAPAKPDFAAVLASADVAKGQKTAKKCAACHKFEKGVNATGPSLYGVVGRPIGTEAGFSYSKAIAGLGGSWEPARLNEFLTKPKAYAPGTKMTFPGLKKITDRANVIAFLATLHD